MCSATSANTCIAMPKKKKSKLQKRKDNERSTYWKAKADTEWGRVIHKTGGVLGQGPRCAVTGRTDGKLDAHHLISKGRGKTRHLPENGMLLSMRIHKYDPEISPHAAPEAWSKWLQENHPEVHAWILENNRHDPLWKPDYKAAYERLKDL